MKKYFFTSIFVPAFLSIFVIIFLIPFSQSYNISFTYSDEQISYSNTNNYIWPSKYTCITSNFGYRKAPTNGASTYHGGIDIGAPEGSNVYAIADGIATYTGFYGANGYTVIISHSNNIKSFYSHILPEFVVSKRR